MGGDRNVRALAVDKVVAVGDDGIIYALFQHFVCCIPKTDSGVMA